MSRQVGYRVTALALGGLLLGVPLLTNGTANADQVPGGGRQVVFSGDRSIGLSCTSEPSVESMTVPAASTIRVVNRTGHIATLRLGGTEKGMLTEGGSAEVVFRRGTTAVLLSPSCPLGDDSTPLMVTVMPSDPAGVPDAPSDPGDQAGVPASPSDSAAPSASSGGAMPDSASPAAQPQRPAPGRVPARTTGARPSSAVVAATAVEAMPQGGSAPRFKTKLPRGTDSAAAPAFSGMPPGTNKTLLPGVPSIGLPTTTDQAAGDGAAPTAQAAAAEPVAAMEPLPDSGRIGLLAAIAIVLVLGVAVAAIRAFVSQRASRTNVA